MRPSGRAADALREISFTSGFARHAEGSCLIRMGGTEVLCAASVEGKVPPFLRNTGQGCNDDKGQRPHLTIVQPLLVVAQHARRHDSRKSS